MVYYSNSSRLDSGLITVFRNRVGDVFFLLGFYFFSLSGAWWNDVFCLWGGVLFFCAVFFGAITKRAQIPFSAWLPAAMAAPTPVSSLVHSSTLVTAGVYVLIRYHVLFSGVGWFVKVFSILTMVLGGITACFEKDFKKVIAISTLSQLGMMLFVLSIGIWVLSYLHMLIHAFFKSILFLRAGSLISHNFGGQDSRFYGGYFFGGVGYVYFLIRCLSLSGFPFVIGFYSKDTIISSLSLGRGFVFLCCFFFGCFLTVCYRVRLV